ncbi:MAG TPA: phosphonate dehydrogenase [Candidatus Saccharimonadales bacterium]|nr:phosphonate dehydrogenase [Candidatus Saccharimonadales bacterium]
MTSARPRVVVTHQPHRQVIDLLSATCTVTANDTLESWPMEKLRAHAAEAAALMVFMPDSVDDAFLARCPKLKIIAAALKGYDNFDVRACTRRGVWFSVVPDLLTVPTAELAMSLILGLTRNLAAGDRLVRSGSFRGWRPVLYGSGLHGRTVGIVGMGKLGRVLAQMLHGHGTRTIYADPAPMAATEETQLGVARVEFGELLAHSNIVVLLLPLQDATLHLMDARAIAVMQPGSFLVNVGRGSVVDEKAVADALDSGHLAGYAADVFEMEDWARPDRPRSIDARLLRHADRTLFTPHLGSAVAEARLQIELAAAGNILQALRGERPADAVNQI